MTKIIQPLSPGVVKKLRSGIAFMSVAHCVEELVLNSIDASANCIAVNVNLPLYQFQVVDNGCGIDIEQMKVIGTRYATSKCHTLEDLENLRSGGFRGEALSSLKEISSILMIESRSASSAKTYCKIFTQGKALDPKQSLNSRPSRGTTVTVYDFMYNMPVRKKSISDSLDLEECRKLLQSIALMYPNISFTLKNEATGDLLLQLKKCSSLYHSFLQMFGKSKANNLKNIEYQKDEYEIGGCISTVCHVSKDLQFLYVNKRHVLRTKLHKLVNSILNKALSSKQKPSVISNSLTPNVSSPSKNQSHCIFALNISCPYDKYDIIFEPRKTMIEFSDWDLVLRILEEALIDFLKREHLYSDSNEMRLDMPNSISVENATRPNFDVTDCQQGLFSHVVRRLNFPDTADSRRKEMNRIENLGQECNESVNNFAKGGILKSTIENTRMSTELDSEFGKSPRNGETSISLLDSCILRMDKNNPEVVEKYGASSSPQKTEIDIPCRSIFPSENPIMLRVPAKSTLSDLQTTSSDSNLLKLKEKLKHFIRKESTYPINGGRLQRKCTDTLKLKGMPQTSPFGSHSTHSSPSLNFCEKKLEAKLKEFNQNNMISKSSQCPSVSADSQNTVKSIGNDGTKEVKDKSLQCPSVSTVKQTRVLSRFTFDDQSAVPPLLLKKYSRRSQKKSPGKPQDDESNFLDFAADYSEGCKIKKLKLSHVTEDSEIDIWDRLSENENSSADIEEFRTNPKVLDSCEENTSSFQYNKSESNSFPATHPEQTLQLSAFDSFALQTFTSGESKKRGNICMLDESEKGNTLQQDLSQRTDNYLSENEVDYRKFSPRRMLDEIIRSIEELEENNSCLTDANSESHLKNVNLFVQDSCMEFETSYENSLSGNVLNNNFKTVSPTVNVTEYGTSSDLDDLNNLPNISTNDNTVECVRKISPCLIIYDEVDDSSYACKRAKMSKLDSVENASSLVMEERAICGTDFESDPFTEKVVPSSENSKLLEERAVCSIEFESDPFTEKLASSSENLKALKENDLEEKCYNSENGPNCSSAEPFFEQSVTSPGNKNTLTRASIVEISNRGDASNILKNTDISEENHLEACCGSGKDDNSRKLDETAGDAELKIHARWKLHLQSDSNRKIYVDTVTGNTTYCIPEVHGAAAERHAEQTNSLKKSHFFLTHDYSPFISKTQTPDNLKNHASNVQNELKDFIENNELHEQRKKWRLSEEASDCIGNVENLLSSWVNPMFDIPHEVTSAPDYKISQNVSQMYSILNSYRFSKSTLHSLQVIGQVDCKFIACILKDFNENSKDQRLLALFDQHAVHERIRLEELTEDLYETQNDGRKSVKTSVLSTSLQVSFSDDEIRLLQAYDEKLRKIGIYISIDDDTRICYVDSVPICLVHKETGDLRRSVADTINILQNSVSEWLSSVVKTRSIPQVLPKTLLSVLNYQACRGAVKFGDPLSFEQCCDLMKSLSTCNLPFQCAHGRPSIAPILDLKKVEALYKERPPPNLGVLLEQFKD